MSQGRYRVGFDVGGTFSDFAVQAPDGRLYEAMEQYPVRMIESGPAAGTLMAAAYGELAGQRDLVAFDMGGTTAKLALIENGAPPTASPFELHRVGLAPGSGLPMNIQAIDLVEIGAGGGSIASVRLGAIAVGPESASSMPGPACYGRGGHRPTVTGANLLLGYLSPSGFAGGTLPLDVAAARRAVPEHVAAPLGLSVAEAAWGIHLVVNSDMELATRVVSIERGRDPRGLALVAFGGSGPAHGCRLARALGVPRVILPAAAGVTAALGLLAAELRYDVARTHVRRLDAVDGAYLDAMFAEMAAQAVRVVRDAAADAPVAVRRSADCRYLGQGYELAVPVPDGPLGEAAIAEVRRAFDEAYAQRYGYASPGEAVEAVTWKVAAVGAGPRLALPASRGAGRSTQHSEAGVRCTFLRRADTSTPRSTGATSSRPAWSWPARR
jgi:N-methylhydantoinase A